MSASLRGQTATCAQLMPPPSRVAAPCSRSSLTFSEEVDDVVGIEAELVGILGIIGVQCPALGYLRLGLGLGPGLGSAPSGWGTACRLPASTVELQRKAELSVPTPNRQALLYASTQRDTFPGGKQVWPSMQSSL